MEKDEKQNHEVREPMVEIPLSLLLALVTGDVHVEMKAVSLGELLEKEKVN